MEIALLLANTTATLALTGLIWFVQVVHYPLFVSAQRDAFSAFALEHSRRTTRVVAPLMVVELVTAAGLCLWRPDAVPLWLAVVGVVLVAIAWISTAMVQVPIHRQLAAGFDSDLLRQLVWTNWMRTVTWSGRAAIVLAMLWLTMR